MWIFTPRGFYSIVEKPEDRDADTLTVRTRSMNAMSHFCREANVDINLVVGKEAWPSDYPFRVRVPRSVVSDWIVDRIRALRYSNFKNEAMRVGQAGYERALHAVWSACLPMTPGNVRKAQREASDRAWQASAARWRSSAPGRIIAEQFGDVSDDDFYDVDTLFAMSEQDAERRIAELEEASEAGDKKAEKTLQELDDQLTLQEMDAKRIEDMTDAQFDAWSRSNFS